MSMANIHMKKLSLALVASALCIALGRSAWGQIAPLSISLPLSASQGGTGSSAGFVLGDVAVGASNGGLVDSGVQPAKNFSSPSAPTVNSDTTQGFSIGSIWVETPSGPMFYATSVSQGAAVWGQATPVAYHPYETKTFGFGNIASGLTYYFAVDAAGVNQNYGNIAAKSGTLSTLYISTAASPGAGQTYVFTLYVGTLRAMAATSVTCTVSGASATSCSDLVDTAAITAGQEWAVQLVTSSGAAGTAQSMVSLLVTY